MARIALPDDSRPILGIAIPRDPDQPRLARLFAPKDDAMWLQVDSSGRKPDHTLRFDGKRWMTESPAHPYISDIWIDPRGTAWALGGSEVSMGFIPTPVAKNDGSGWRLVSTPKDFQVTRITGTAADDVWFLSAFDVFQWDGSQWHWGDFRPGLGADFPERDGVHEAEFDVRWLRPGGLYMDPKGSDPKPG